MLSCVLKRTVFRVHWDESRTGPKPIASMGQSQMSQASLNEHGDPQPQISFGKLSGIQELPAFPAVAGKLLTVITDEDADFREVSRLILTDTALSGQVLRLANSSLFG